MKMAICHLVRHHKNHRTYHFLIPLAPMLSRHFFGLRFLSFLFLKSSNSFLVLLDDHFTKRIIIRTGSSKSSRLGLGSTLFFDSALVSEIHFLNILQSLRQLIS